MTETPLIALTGATGFIGTALYQRLIAHGFRVRALYRPRAGRVMNNDAALEWVAGDLDDSEALARLTAGADAVIHCAGAVRGASRADFDRVNVTGVYNLTRAAGAAGCRRFLLLSSLAAREPHLSDYAASKRAGEDILKQESGRLTWTILRPPAVYGPGDREMLPLFRSMARGLALVPGAGDGRVSLIYVADLVAAAVSWIAAGNDNASTYELDDGHVGGYDWPTIMAIAARVSARSRPIRRLSIPVPLLNVVGWINLMLARRFNYAPMLTPGKVRELTHSDWVSHNDGAFADATGWQPMIDFEQGLARTLKTHSVDHSGLS